MKPQILKYDSTREFFFEEQCYINELSNSEKDREVSIALARVKPGVSTHWHKLKDIVERYVILKGKGVVEIGDLPPQMVQPNDVVIIPAGCKQRITNPASEDLVFLAICSPRFESTRYEDINP